MKAIVITTPGPPEVLQLHEVPNPELPPHHVLVKVFAAGINRADVVQRQGRYPPPPGAPLYPGLECSGVIEELGEGVGLEWKVGDQVCALLGGGGYAEKVAVPIGQLLPIPKGVSLQNAAALPEVACTVWSTVFMTSRLSAGESFLMIEKFLKCGIPKNWPAICHVDRCMVVQVVLAHLLFKWQNMLGRVFCTAGSDEKLEQCRELGADVIINYKNEDFVNRVKNETNGKGVNVILDIMGATYFQRNLDALSMDGRLFMIGFQGGSVGEFNLLPIMGKRLTISAAGLRSRTAENKAQIVAEVRATVWPAIEQGKVKPLVYKTFPLEKAADAHRVLESSVHTGKILLTILTT